MTTNRDNHKPRPTNHATNHAPNRTFALFAAILMVAMTFTPTAAAETDEHTICIADSDGIDRTDDPGTGCARATIRTVDNCWDDASTGWTCDIRAKPITIEVSGINTCGSANLTDDTDKAMACTDVRENDLFRSDSIDDFVDRYTHIPAKGRTVEIPVYTCTWPNGLTPLAECTTWTHEHRLDGNPNDHGDVIDFVFNTVENLLEFADKTVENAESPVTVSP